MGETASFDLQAFRDFEHAAWEEQASDYHSVASGRIEVVESLLDAAEVGPGDRLLDVACGTGVLTQAAAGRGAHAIGLDFSASMVGAARRHCPGLDFREGDAEDLPFNQGSFDTVICSFGLLHFPHPDRAISEAFRVLAPAGRYLFTVWSPPERSPFHGLILGAIKAHGDLDVPIPKGPPMFRFGDPEESRRVLLATGFRDPSVTEIPFFVRSPDPARFLDLIYKRFPRTLAVLHAQTPEAREKIKQALLEGASRFEKDGAIEIPRPAVMASARKP